MDMFSMDFCLFFGSKIWIKLGRKLLEFLEIMEKLESPFFLIFSEYLQCFGNWDFA